MAQRLTDNGQTGPRDCLPASKAAAEVVDSQVSQAGGFAYAVPRTPRADDMAVGVN